MKIIHVAQFLGIGGLEKIVYHLALEQQAQGHDVKIYIYDYERTWVPFFRESGLNVITPELKKDGYDLSLLKRMNADLFQADILHTHDLNPLMYLGPLSLWKKMTFQKRPKLIHTTHGMDHVTNYPRAKLYEKIASRMADKVVGVSQKVGKFYLEEIKLSKKKIEIIENGIAVYKKAIEPELREEKRRWLIEKHNLDPKLPIVLSLSRIVPLKDQKFLIEAFKQRPNYQLLVAGPPSDPTYYEHLKILIGREKHIQLIGPQDKVADYNLGSDLYVSASTHEGIPVAVLEAMAVETPSLVSNIAGHLTLNQHGHNVDIFNIHVTEDFLLKCDNILGSNKQQSLLQAKEARSVVEKYFSVAKMNEHYLKVYQE